MTLIETNPFLLHDIASQCAICNIELEINKTCSIHDVIQSQNIEAYEALISISNFDCYNVDEGPQKLCKNCFRNISNAYKFQKQCNKAAANIVAFLKYQQENSNVIIIKEENNVDYYKETSPVENESKQFNENISDTQIMPDDVPLTKETNSDKEHSDSSTGNHTSSNSSTDTFTILKSVEEDLEQDLLNHKDNMQPNNELLPISKKKKARKKYKLVECEICHKILGSNNIKEHLRGHSDEKPYSCNICDKKFNRKNNLKKHQAIHDNRRSFLCNVCGKSFNINASLLEHERIHTGERPYSCKICGKAFTHSYTLKNHYAVHSDEKLFTCEICGKSFGTKKSLNQHSSVHMENKNHDCKMCGNQFKTTYALRIHLKNHCKGLS